MRRKVLSEKCKRCNGSGHIGRPLRKGEPNPLLAEVDYDQVTVYEPCPDCSCRQSVDTSDQSGDTADMIDHVPDAGEKVPPPEGYPTWLDYLVATMEIRCPQTDTLLTPSGEQAAARAELAELRAKVARQQDMLYAVRMVLDA